MNSSVEVLYYTKCNYPMLKGWWRINLLFHSTDCFAVFFDLFIGRLHHPVNIKAEFKTATVCLSWTPPFLLQGVLIYEYLVNLVVTSMSNSSMDQRFNTSNLSVSFDALDNSYCTVYFICVQAVTLAGIGQQGCINSSRIGGYPTC